MDIYTKYIDTDINKIEISSTDEHITSIMFVDAKKHPSPNMEESSEIPNVLNNAISQLKEYFRGNRKQFDIPIKQEGSDFQQKVWKELENIPCGETISYLELAERLGDRKVIRAAASANGKNKINIIIPCHRVISTDGKLVGYGGDVWRKKWLLNFEYENSDKKGRLF